ncbi:hypothetical protein BDN67DRAFT_973287 [Paxillus ammoniavirescens]|nr:hypothetical protein BDN67DRAFT_973287 [Paxillus ammoniavirescens]
MKTFLTLLAAITSLSAYTLVGVHAGCAICPTSLSGEKLYNVCATSGKITSCEYKNGVVVKFHCYYHPDGTRDKASDTGCLDNVDTGNDCHCTSTP